MENHKNRIAYSKENNDWSLLLYLKRQRRYLNKKALFLCTLLFAGFMYGQNATIGQFAIWKPKNGESENFEKGYKQHLNWHKVNKDQWGWYGWFFISGPRYGQFVDATFDHIWADFDTAVKPADDMADNKLNVFPFGDVQTIFKVENVPKASSIDTFALKTKLIKLVTLTVDNVEQSIRVSEKLKDYYVSRKIKFYKTYKVVDGGSVNQIILMLGFDSWNDYSLSENLHEKITEYQQMLKIKTISAVESETMIYRPDMSWFPNS
ncbi:hypothetical protein [Chryseobacterium lactis]|nr:hypothetical protein [Chryseobacterium lactis]